MSEPIIRVQGLWHVYMPMEQLALKDVNLEIYPGEFIALVGQNGSGKTTLVKHFNGLLKPTRGAVIVNGKDTRNASVSELASTVGYVFQNPDHQIFAETVREEVSFGPKNLGFDSNRIKETTERVLAQVGLSEYIDEMPFTLGRGQRQRLAVASVLSMEPSVLIIDEPTTGLDWGESVRMMELVRTLNEKGHTIIMTTHNMAIVALYAKRVCVLRLGEKILDGPTSCVFKEVEKLKTAFVSPPQLFRLSDLMQAHEFDDCTVDGVTRYFLRLLKGE
ncbi:MAG: ATP-binding cassette domain-containing protein [Bacillota bacterium]